MAYIAPNSIVQIIRGIPWNNTYRDSVVFPNASAQHTAITTSVKYTFTAQSYQRAGKGRIKLNVLCDNVYDCNYMCFQNTAYGNKWFYAFIIDVEYINNDTTMITYQIDVLQTWMFDYVLLPCFIERQHTTSDNIGEHLMEEDLALGELVTNTAGTLTTFSNYVIVFALLCDAYYDTTENNWIIDNSDIGQLQDSCYSAAQFVICDTAQHANELVDKINEFMGSTDSILSIFMYPAGLVSGSFPNYVWNGQLTQNYFSAPKPGTFDNGNLNDGRNKLNGHKVRNKRLFSYPFSQIMITDGAKENVVLRPELFNEPNDSNNMHFDLWYEKSMNPTLGLMPRYYKSVAQNDAYTTIMLSGFPMCTWESDTFKAYIAQTYGPAFASWTPQKTDVNLAIAGTGMGLSTIGVAVGKGMQKVGNDMGKIAGLTATAAGWSSAKSINAELLGEKGGDVLSATGEMLENISSKTRELTAKYLESNQVHGNASDTSLVNFGFLGYHIYYLCPKAEYAEMADDYFDLFGYAIKRLDTPNIQARPYWTYVKTIGCKIDGNIPFDHESVICSIFDSGITWWTGIDAFGRYDLNNQPI